MDYFFVLHMPPFTLRTPLLVGKTNVCFCEAPLHWRWWRTTFTKASESHGLFRHRPIYKTAKFKFAVIIKAIILWPFVKTICQFCWHKLGTEI